MSAATEEEVASLLIGPEETGVPAHLEAESELGTPFKPLDDSEVEYRLGQLLHDAYTFGTGKLAREREKSIQHYLGEKVDELKERQGRSSVVLTEVRDTIEWIKPALIKIFTQTDELGVMEPQGPEDEEQAQQRTDYANWVFFRDNPGFMRLYDWFTDALMQKTGWAKTYWDPSPRAKKETYQGLTEAQAVELTNTEGVEIIEAEEFEDVIDGMPVRLFNLVILRTEDDGRVRIEVIPPEEVRWNRDARNVDDAILWQHRREMLESDLVELGYDPEMVRNLAADDSGEFDEEEIARETVDDEPSFSVDQRIGATRKLYISECYFRCDRNGDGVAEWLKCFMVGDNDGNILPDPDGESGFEEVDGHPFSWLCPVPMPHRIAGLSVTDLVLDLQVIKSTILRQILDGLYLANNPRWKAKKGKVSYAHLLRNVPGAPIEVEEMDALEPIQQPYNAGEIGMPVLDFLGTVGEKRTGVSSTYQAVDVDALDKTAFAAAQTMGQAVSRIEQIARIFAETGVKDVFKRIDGLTMKHQKIQRQIRLRGSWIEVDPSSWEHEMDTTINVGIGSGSREILAQNLGHLASLVERIAGGYPGWVQPDNIYNLFAKISENLGFKNPTQFLPDPTQEGFQLPPPEPTAEDRKLENDRLKILLEHEREMIELRVKHGEKIEDMETDRAKLLLGAAELEEKIQTERRLDRVDSQAP